MATPLNMVRFGHILGMIGSSNPWEKIPLSCAALSGIGWIFPRTLALTSAGIFTDSSIVPFSMSSTSISHSLSMYCMSSSSMLEKLNPMDVISGFIRANLAWR